MSLNITRLKKQVEKAISINPTVIELKRAEKIDDGMNGFNEIESDVATFNGFIDDSSHSIWQDRMNESGTVQRTRNITLLAVCDNFEIQKDDYFVVGADEDFDIEGIKYKVIYPGKIVDGIYNADLEVVS